MYNNMPNKKTLIIIAVLVVVAAVAAVALVSYQHQRQNKIAKQPEKTAVNNGTGPLSLKSVDNSKLPANISQDMISEPGAEVLQNYEAANSGTKSQQSTRIFVIKKSLADTFSWYKDYFAKNGWTIIASIDQADLKALSAVKDSANLDININHNAASGQSTVNLSLSYPAATLVNTK